MRPPHFPVGLPALLGTATAPGRLRHGSAPPSPDRPGLSCTKLTCQNTVGRRAQRESFTSLTRWPARPSATNASTTRCRGGRVTYRLSARLARFRGSRLFRLAATAAPSGPPRHSADGAAPTPRRCRTVRFTGEVEAEPQRVPMAVERPQWASVQSITRPYVGPKP